MVFKYYSPIKGTRFLKKKWLILGLVPGEKDKPDASSSTSKKMSPRTYQRDTEITLKELRYGQGWNNLREKINNTVLDYNPKYKINLRESILI